MAFPLYVCIRCNREFSWDKEGRPGLCDQCTVEVGIQMIQRFRQALLEIFKARVEVVTAWSKEDDPHLRGQAIWVIALEMCYATELDDFLKQAQSQGQTASSALSSMNRIKLYMRPQLLKAWEEANLEVAEIIARKIPNQGDPALIAKVQEMIDNGEI